jgi:hypothetical protein
MACLEHDDDLGFDCGTCDYFNVNNVTVERFCNSILHINIRSLSHKTCHIEVLLNMLGFPKIVMLTEVWITHNTPALDIDGYTLLTSPRLSNRWGGVAMYVQSSLQFIIKYKSFDHPNQNNFNIDYLLIQILNKNIALACMYCPPKTPLANIISVIEHMKSLLSPSTSLLVGGDYNINLLSTDTALPSEFIDNLHSLGLHPIISLPTRVTDSTATLLDNFLCDINLLPFQAGVIKTDFSDHYAIEFSLNSILNTSNISLTKRNFCSKNKIKFSTKLLVADWSHLYTILDTNAAFNYFIKKLKKIYNKCFRFENHVITNKKPPWLTKGLLKSINHKNELFIKAKNDSTHKQVYNAYRNKLTSLIRKAKYNYHSNVLNQLKNNSRKMWAHLRNLTGSNKNNNVPICPSVLNNFFTSVFNQAPKFCNNSHTIPDSVFVSNSLFLTPLTVNEILSTFASLSNSTAIGTDNLLPTIIKLNASLISNQLTYIFNLSFTQGIFPNLLKNAVVVPIYKGGSHSDPSNYRPISILTIFSKLLEKLFYNRLVAFVNAKNILHNSQFGFRKNRSTSLAITYVLTNIINKINNNKKVAFVLLDLKKAFDFINHDLLLLKLKTLWYKGAPAALANKLFIF